MLQLSEINHSKVRSTRMYTGCYIIIAISCAWLQYAAIKSRKLLVYGSERPNLQASELNDDCDISYLRHWHQYCTQNVIYVYHTCSEISFKRLTSWSFSTVTTNWHLSLPLSLRQQFYTYARTDKIQWHTSTPCLKKVDHFYYYDNFGIFHCYIRKGSAAEARSKTTTSLQFQICCNIISWKVNVQLCSFTAQIIQFKVI